MRLVNIGAGTFLTSGCSGDMEEVPEACHNRRRTSAIASAKVGTASLLAGLCLLVRPTRQWCPDDRLRHSCTSFAGFCHEAAGLLSPEDTDAWDDRGRATYLSGPGGALGSYRWQRTSYLMVPGCFIESNVS